MGSSGRAAVVRRLLPTYAHIRHPELFDRIRVKQVPSVNDGGTPQNISDRFQVNVCEFGPFRGDDKDISAFRRGEWAIDRCNSRNRSNLNCWIMCGDLDACGYECLSNSWGR